MSQRDKLWEKANQNPQNLTFNEFETLLKQSEWILKRQRGSHRLWQSPTGQLLPIQPRKDGKAKSYQVQQFIQYQGTV
ncbi:type II toxin-antitoxin system HicA family toxin [Spirulina subsalsa FACHB-351]|uniref:Type II toxin-antitoxin system HicA family toxin n=1 Tax=Spirulina subsalsa FACHB-351 TaxID=234711 RepID=A0ABT3L6Q8_9CYAN|nr:type II toxin-antitoxin system HicA family toxin [Spirulina subsalsa]MCW6037193.1 type II toxin-antitoxin system HicA family toxin [Spirulina subsalsa FACHB-351]